MHQIVHEKRILSAENGFLLGNGDLSVSIYQSETAIIWRFGKGNVWDRRHDLSEDPKPAHIEELRRGVLEEGWKVEAGGEDLSALHEVKDPKRMREICEGSPRSYENHPYPCPKPVGELALHLPPDLMDLSLKQTLSVEEGIVRIHCEQEAVFALDLECWVDSTENILAVDWKLKADRSEVYGGQPPVWLSLYRQADSRVEEFAAAQWAAYHTSLVCGTRAPSKTTPLPPPKAENPAGYWQIRQDFYPENTYPNGSCCLMAPSADAKIGLPRWPQKETAALDITPENCAESGFFTVSVAATDDPHGDQEGLTRLKAIAEDPGFRADSRRRLAAAMESFWSASAFSCEEQLLENLWYENLYAFRCIYRGGTVPPGLFFPSTVKDYAHWHGDYHSNYNFVQPFWGICASNHPEGLDSYFDGMEYFFQIGKKIAHDYYNARGVFVQLSAFPILHADDPIGVAPLGRMAYMTGWAPNLYWQRYLYTMDREWLEKEGYPVLRSCALFYTDFVQKDEAGNYHAFPSAEGEKGFSGNPADLCDCEEVSQYLCYCLRTAIQAAEILHTDADLAAEWQNILDHYPADPAAADPKDSPEYHEITENPPEFTYNYLMERDPHNDAAVKGEAAWPSRDHYVYQWYFGHYILHILKLMHSGKYNAEKSYGAMLKTLRRWRHPNGLFWAMSCANYGQIGAWTETLGVIGVLTDQMLQSWDGCLHLFPSVPAALDASFERFRARGAFLVSAAKKGGEVTRFTVYSEKGTDCAFASPWEKFRVLDESGREVPVSADRWGHPAFATEAGHTYEIVKAC